MEIFREFDNLMLVDEAEAEKEMLLYMQKKGEYFNDASLLYSYLGNLYINQQRYREALQILERKLLYQIKASNYRQLSEVAAHVDKEKSLAYAKEAIEASKREQGNVQAYEEFLAEQQKVLGIK